MSDLDETTRPQGCSGDAAAYVLGALDGQEATAFVRHAQTCVVCRDELAELTAVADVLPLAAPPHSFPRALKRRVMAEVKADQRAGTRAPESARPMVRRRASLWPRPAFAGGLAAVAAAAVAAVIILGSGGTNTKIIHASTSWSGGSATLHVTDGHAELIVDRAPAPPAGEVYEVWLKHPSSPTPSPTNALFTPTSSGAGSVDVPGNLHGVKQVMVTVEPAGGSKVPTHPPVVVANLA